MSSRLLPLACLFLSIQCVACRSLPTHGPVQMAPLAASPAPCEATSTRWEDAVFAASRRAEVYRGPDRQADLRATLITPRLRQLFLAERACFHGRFAEQAQTELLGMGSADEGVGAAPLPRPPGEDQILIFVAFYASDQKNRDLAGHTSIWDTHLVRGTARVAPLAIEPVRLSPAVSSVFSYVDRFDDVYLMRFPFVDSAPGEAPFVLEIKSALANASVSWSIDARTEP